MKEAVYLYDGRGTELLPINIPCEENCASSEKRTVVVYEIHSHLSAEEADALIEKLKAEGAVIEYGREP